MSSKYPQPPPPTLCVMSSRFTNVTDSPGSIDRFDGVKHASLSSTVSPSPWVGPLWQPPPATAGAAGTSRTTRNVAASAIPIRRVMEPSFRPCVDPSTPPGTGRFRGSAGGRARELERLGPAERGLHPVGDAVLALPDEHVPPHGELPEPLVG